MKTEELSSQNSPKGTRQRRRKPPRKTLNRGRLHSFIVILRDMGITLIVMPFAALALLGIIIAAAAGEGILSLLAWAEQKSRRNFRETSKIKTEGPSHGSS